MYFFGLNSHLGCFSIACLASISVDFSTRLRHYFAFSMAVLKLGQGQENGRSGEGLKKVKNAI